MSVAVRLIDADEDFLAKAYLAHPEGPPMNLASLNVLNGDIEAHEQIDPATFERLATLGYIAIEMVSDWTVGKRSLAVTIFRLTPHGREHAEVLLTARRDVGFAGKLQHSNWAMWGAIAAVIAAIASIIGAYISFIALRAH